MSIGGKWSSLPDGWATSLYDGVLPPKLYRYRQLSEDWVGNRADFEIFDEAIFLAGAGSLNDPNEGRVVWVARGSFSVALKIAVEVLQKRGGENINEVDLIAEAWPIARNMVDSAMVPKATVDQMNFYLGKLLRIACFTTRPLNASMWTHYGNYADGNGLTVPHGGICIEYQTNESWRLAGIRPVQYSEKRPEINMLEQDSIEAQFAAATRVKSPDWAYEDEWRLVSYLQTDLPLSENLEKNSKLKLEGAVKSVIFGLNSKGAASETLAEKIRRHSSDILLKRVVRDEVTDDLIISPM